MDANTVHSVAQLGGTVFTVCVFIWYLYQKNGKTERSQLAIAEALAKLHTSQEVHTRVLMRVAQQHGNHGDVADLMEGRNK